MGRGGEGEVHGKRKKETYFPYVKYITNRD